MRRACVTANWKMNGLTGEGIALAQAVAQQLGDRRGVEVVLCPPFTSLAAVAGVLSGGSDIGLGAQNVHWETRGAYTGEVSAAMLHDLGCRYVIVGHSERRVGFHEDDAMVLRKSRAALQAEIVPIVCVGESLIERETGQTDEVIRRQIEGSLYGLGPDLGRVIVAYEPIWAIGTGLTASPEQAQEVHALIRSALAERVGATAADGVRVIYGGSVKADNAEELFAQPDIDGGLIGGASLDATTFTAIVGAALPARG